MDRATEIAQLFRLYNRWFAETSYAQSNRYRVRGFKLTPARKKLFNDLIDWCKARQINPRIWIYLLFRTRRWAHAVPLKPEHLMSERMIERYRKIDGLAAYDYDRRRNDESEAQYDPNRDVTSTTESIKAEYLAAGAAQRCMRQMFVETLGYHPKSQVCARCPVKDECRAMLVSSMNFDVMALRKGKITSAAAKEQARRNGPVEQPPPSTAPELPTDPDAPRPPPIAGL